MLLTVCVTIHAVEISGLGLICIPLQFRGDPEAKRKKPGQPKNQDQEQAFPHMCTYLDEEQLTISDLRNKMKEFLPDNSPPYGNQCSGASTACGRTA